MTAVVLAMATAGLVWAWRFRPQQRHTILVVAAAGGLGFQLVHVLEHVVQAAVWTATPDQPPFLTPWAVAGRNVLAVDGDQALGNELLHLAGNLVFLAGLLAFAALVVRMGGRIGRSLRIALLVQAAHVVEHVALTATTAGTGNAIGVTTLFGTLAPSPALWTLRVTAHLGLNTVATFAAGAAVLAWATRPRAPNTGRTSTASPARPAGPAPGP